MNWSCTSGGPRSDLLFLVAELAQGQGNAHHNRLAFRQDESLFTPSGNDAADREECRAGHLRQLLARKRNLNPSLMLFSNLFGQPHQRRRQALGYSFRSDFAKTLFELLQPVGQDPVDVVSDLRITGKQRFY